MPTIERLIGEQRQRGAWSASTANGTLSAFSFDRWKKAGPGQRPPPRRACATSSPATVRGRRRQTRSAPTCTVCTGKRPTDGARSNRALYVLALRPGGVPRGAGPLGLAARRLDDPIPFIEWQPSWHKTSGRCGWLAPELAEKLPRIRPSSGWGPCSRPSRPRTFSDDADRAEIPYTDAGVGRTRRNSLRKWHRTTLISLGCPGSLADKLMVAPPLRGAVHRPQP